LQQHQIGCKRDMMQDYPWGFGNIAHPKIYFGCVNAFTGIHFEQWIQCVMMYFSQRFGHGI
jgi:hypothetical protein